MNSRCPPIASEKPGLMKGRIQALVRFELASTLGTRESMDAHF
jgi:hypothetical protein